MPKSLSTLLIAVAVVLVAGVGYIFISGQNDGNELDSSPFIEQSEATNTQQEINENDQSAAVGSYVDYSEEELLNTDGKRVLFFHAPWCPQCRELDSSIRAGSVPNDTTIFKVDYDSNQSLRQKYGVTIQTTVILLDEEGNVSTKYVPYDNPSLSSVITGLGL